MKGSYKANARYAELVGKVQHTFGPRSRRLNDAMMISTSQCMKWSYGQSRGRHPMDANGTAFTISIGRAGPEKLQPVHEQRLLANRDPATQTSEPRTTRRLSLTEMKCELT